MKFYFYQLSRFLKLPLLFFFGGLLISCANDGKDKIKPSFCITSYEDSTIYNSEAAFKEMLEEKAKEVILREHFELLTLDKITNVNNEWLRKDIICYLSNQLNFSATHFGNSKRIGESCVWLELDDEYLTNFKKVFNERKKVVIPREIDLGSSNTIYEKGIHQMLLFKKRRWLQEHFEEEYFLIENFEDDLLDQLFVGERTEGSRNELYSAFIYPLAIEALTCGSYDILGNRIVRRTGFDQEGRKVAFEFIYFLEDYTWNIGSVEEVKNESGEKLQIKDLNSSRRFSNYLDQRRLYDIISVGTASAEIAKDGDEDREILRARLRSYQLADMMRDISGEKRERIANYFLNLGVFQAEKTSIGSDFQRRILIIGIVDKHEHANVEEALQFTLKRYQEMNANDYSTFEFGEFNLQRNDLKGKIREFELN